MTTHPVPVGTGQWQSSDLPAPTTGAEQLRAAASRLNATHARTDDTGQLLLAEDTEGDPHDRPALPRRVPGDTVARTEVAAGITALADFVLEAADVPLPYLVRGHHMVPDVLTLEVLAERLGCKIYGPDATPQFNYTISRSDGTVVELIVAVKRPDRPL
jgi:hypothetical protein